MALAETAVLRQRDACRAVAAATAACVGQAFLDTLVRALGPALDVDAVTILEGPGGGRVPRRVAAWSSPRGQRAGAPRLDLALCCDGERTGTLRLTGAAVRTLSDDAQTGLAIFAARAGAELGRLAHEAQLRRRLVEAGDAERRRIGRDLHDGVQQTIAAATHAIDLAGLLLPDEGAEAARAQLEAARTRTTAAAADVRALARGLHPAGLALTGLGPALRRVASGAALPVHLAALPRRSLGELAEVTIFYVVSEAVTNAVRHAEASAVVVRVGERPGAVVVTVEDDGRGGAQLAAGSGLAGLAERLAALGGVLLVDSPRGAGTRVEARLPAAVVAELSPPPASAPSR